jgi:short-subunit dehydrogenase
MTKTGLVTGATAGIGRSFAEHLARDGYDLVLVARDESRLATTKDELEKRYSIAVELIPADLSTAEGVAAVATRLESDERPIDFLVNNAGFGSKNSFVEMTKEDHDEMVRVNVNALVILTRAAMGGMVQRNRGDIINVGSVAAFTPGFRSSSTYSATKAFVVAFTEGLMPTTAGTNVHASVLCPGFVKTEFHTRAGIHKGKLNPALWLEADYVVAHALRDHRKGRLLSVPSLRYKAIVAIVRLVPRNFLLKQMNRMGKR